MDRRVRAAGIEVHETAADAALGDVDVAGLEQVGAGLTGRDVGEVHIQALFGQKPALDGDVYRRVEHIAESHPQPDPGAIALLTHYILLV